MLTDEHHAVNTMIDQGAAFDQIEDYIDTLALPGEQLSALWLLRGDPGVAAIKELTDGLGAQAELLRAVGTQESMTQAIHATRPGGHVGFVGVAPGVAIDGMDLFWSLAHVHGGPAPVRRFLPELIDLIWNRQINPGKVFDLQLPLDETAAGYRAMDQREAIKMLLRP
ncbi:MAG: hypothetical protein WBP81_01380 [Solirubrobacteraceae bacterium]